VAPTLTVKLNAHRMTVEQQEFPSSPTNDFGAHNHPSSRNQPASVACSGRGNHQVAD